MVGVIIQARLGSTRLPGKVALPFGGGTLLGFLLARIIRAELPDILVVATTTNPIDDSIQGICNQLKIPVFRGAEQDVLQRYIDTAQYFGISTIIRICADNPFIDPFGIDQLIDGYNRMPADYYSFQFSNGLPAILSPIGFYGELVTLRALLSIKTRKAPAHFLEHVTQYIYSHSEDYSIRNIPIPGELETTPVRLTVDTQVDYEIALEVGKLIGFDVTTSAAAIYRKVRAQPELVAKMYNQIQSNPKVYHV